MSTERGFCGGKDTFYHHTRASSVPCCSAVSAELMIMIMSIVAAGWLVRRSVEYMPDSRFHQDLEPGHGSVPYG